MKKCTSLTLSYIILRELKMYIDLINKYFTTNCVYNKHIFRVCFAPFSFVRLCFCFFLFISFSCLFLSFPFAVHYHRHLILAAQAPQIGLQALNSHPIHKNINRDGEETQTQHCVGDGNKKEETYIIV
jgi:hypothetical protein